MGCLALLFTIINPIMKAILQSPFHTIISRKIMTITFRGTKSSRQYSTPVSYYREGDRVICFTHGPWWRNIGDGAEVKVRIQGQDFTGPAVAIDNDEDLKVANLTKMMKAVPGDAGFYSIKLDENGEPVKVDVENAAKGAVLIRIQLKD